MLAHRRKNEARRRTLSREQFDSVRLHVGPGRGAELLASQAAISLENATLYSDLQREGQNFV